MLAFMLDSEIQNSPSTTAVEKAHSAAVRDLFDPLFYLALEPAQDPFNPLLHYIRVGCRAGRQPNPLFDRDYYRSQIASSESEDALLHYCKIGIGQGLSPHPLDLPPLKWSSLKYGFEQGGLARWQGRDTRQKRSLRSFDRSMC
jgi:hypothetical protein